MHWNIVYTGITLLSTDDKHIQKTKNSLRRPPAASKVQYFPLHLIFRKLCSSLAHKRLVFIKNQTLTGCAFIWHKLGCTELVCNQGLERARHLRLISSCNGAVMFIEINHPYWTSCPGHWILFGGP